MRIDRLSLGAQEELPEGLRGRAGAWIKVLYRDSGICCYQNQHNNANHIFVYNAEADTWRHIGQYSIQICQEVVTALKSLRNQVDEEDYEDD